MQNIDWYYLVPGIEVISGTPGSIDKIVLALFALMVVLFLFCCFTLWKQFKVFKSKRVAIAELVDGTDKQTLAAERQAVIDRATQSPVDGIRELWREFDESLVYSSDLTQLYNTLDAEHFFNARTMAGGLTSNRLLAATPSFLTAIGVLGTFLGLTLGLSGLDFSSNELEELKTGINQMISGAGAAFVSSVWGVLLSLILNAIEKGTERNVLKSITSLQHKIDFLYPRLPAEKVLVDINDHSRKSQESLSGLAEQIGDKLQESVEGMSRSMQDAISKTLTEILNPALSAMSSNASQQSTQALEALIEQFSTGLRAEGQKQKESMDGAADAVNQAMAGITDKMDILFNDLSEKQAARAREDSDRTRILTEQINQQQTQAEEQQAQLASQFEGHISALSGQQKAMVAEITAATTEQIGQLTDLTNKQTAGMASAFATAVQGMEQQTQQQLTQLTEQASTAQTRFNAMVESVTGEQQKLLSEIANAVNITLEQARQLATQHQQLMDKLQGASASMEASSSHMNTSATQLGLLSTNLKSASEQLGEHTKEVTDNLNAAARQNLEAYAGVKEQVTTLSELEEAVIEASGQFEETAKLAETSFTAMSTHQRDFLQNVKTEFNGLARSLTKEIESLEQQASDWLSEYSDQVSTQVEERMGQWNNQTREFSDQMLRSVTAISGLLDDLEAHTVKG